MLSTTDLCVSIETVDSKWYAVILVTLNRDDLPKYSGKQWNVCYHSLEPSPSVF